MLETDLEAAPAQRLPERTPAPQAGELIARLRAVKIEPRLLQSTGGLTAGGVALRIPVCSVLQSPSASEHHMRRIARLVRTDVPVTLSLRDLGTDDVAIASLEEFAIRLRRALSVEQLSSDAIGISLQSHLLPLQAYLVVTTALLGNGPRYVVLDSLQMRHHGNRLVQDETDNNWSFLWRRRHARPALMPAYAASVITRCPLLGDEAATTILPEAGIQVPVDTAWLPLPLHLPDFSDGRGRLRWNALQNALRCAVDSGEMLLDQLSWPEGAQASDAALNRRLAVTLSGIGDLVVERGASPRDLATLQWVDRIVAQLHASLWRRSRELAQKLGPLPSLLQTEPATGWDESPHKSDWQLRWRQALAGSAVRHRNLLVLSPYSVLPASDASAADFIDLLPVLHHADAFSFAAIPGGGYRNVDEFANFHRRAWAVMQRRNAASFIAAGA